MLTSSRSLTSLNLEFTDISMISSHLIGGNQKLSLHLRNTDKKLLETVFLITICHQWGDKLQSKTLFLTIFDLSLKIVLTFLIATYTV